MALKNIVFDLGGVLIHLNFLKTQQAFEALGVNNFKQQYSQHTASTLFENLEIGKINKEEFVLGINDLANAKLSELQVLNAWNAMLLHFDKEVTNKIKYLKNGYQLFLLSNTNAIHQAVFKQLYLETIDKHGLDSLFTKAYYSHEIGLRKPNADIFEYVLKDNNIIANETLFIDDTVGNIDAANILGFKTVCLKTPKHLLDIDFNAF
jgi:glucose-1-phosphatase